MNRWNISNEAAELHADALLSRVTGKPEGWQG